MNFIRIHHNHKYDYLNTCRMVIVSNITPYGMWELFVHFYGYLTSLVDGKVWQLVCWEFGGIYYQNLTHIHRLQVNMQSTSQTRETCWKLTFLCNKEKNILREQLHQNNSQVWISWCQNNALFFKFWITFPNERIRTHVISTILSSF